MTREWLALLEITSVTLLAAVLTVLALAALFVLFEEGGDALYRVVVLLAHLLLLAAALALWVITWNLCPSVAKAFHR